MGRAPILFRGTSDCVFEYCYIARNESNPNEHSEAISAFSGTDRNVFRYCIFEDVEGTGCIVFSGDGWEIYGNVIFFTPGYTGDKFGNGAIATWSAAEHYTTNVKIYNNVFANLGDALNGGLGLKPGNNVAYNNLWYKCDRPRMNGVSHDYNSLYDCDDNSAVSGEAHGQVLTGHPFMNLATKNLRLGVGTAPGLKLNSPYEQDPEGRIRGADGTWDRGAFEFGGASGGNRAPVPNAGPDRGVVIGAEVILDDSSSSDPNGDALTYLWAQISGQPVQLSGTTTALARFTPLAVGTYAFRLTVNDGQVSASDEVTVAVSLQVATDGLLAYWKADESSGMIARDFTGSHDGTLMNGPVWQPSGGKIGGAMEFDGVDDYVEIGTIDIIGGAGLTLALWFKADDLFSSYARLISKAMGSTTDEEHYWMLGTGESDGTGLRFRLKAGGSTTLLKTSAGQIAPGTWYHIAATYDGNQMRLFKNGVQVASTNKSGAVDTNSNVWAAIGNQPAAAGNWPFDGVIDEVRVYNRALSTAEIAAIANVLTSVDSEDSAQDSPIIYDLSQNYPNPFYPSTTISFSLPNSGLVVLSVYSLLGQQIASLVNAKLPAGKHAVQWTPQDVPSGVYYYRIEAGSFVQTMKMLLAK